LHCNVAPHPRQPAVLSVRLFRLRAGHFLKLEWDQSEGRVFETPTLAVIIASVQQEWVQTILGIGPVVNYIKQYYIHKFYNFFWSFLFNHQIIYSCVHFAILTLKLPIGIALSYCLYLMSYYWSAGDVIWRNGNLLEGDLGRFGSVWLGKETRLDTLCEFPRRPFLETVRYGVLHV